MGSNLARDAPKPARAMIFPSNREHQVAEWLKIHWGLIVILWDWTLLRLALLVS